MSDPTTSMMTTDERDEWLVAYLDGELSGDERRSLEQRLIDEEPLRLRLRELQKSWDLLTLLPSPETDERMVHTTLEMVVKDLAGSTAGLSADLTSTPTQRGGTQPKRRWNWSRSMAMVAISAVVVAAVGTWRQYRRGLAERADWAVAMDVDAYEVGGNLELIRQLATIPSWQRLVSESPTAELDPLVQPGTEATLFGDPESFTPTVSVSQWNDRLGQLEPETRAIASTRWERFESLAPPRREELRQTAIMIRAQPDAATLLDTLRRYARWRERLPAELVDEIESDDPAKRFDAIERGVRESLSDIARISGDNLSDEAVERIAYTLEEIVQSRLEDMEPRTVAWHRLISGRLGLSRDPRQLLRAVAFGIVFSDPESRSRNGFLSGFPSPDRGPIDRGPGERGPIDRGPGDRGPIDRGQGDRERSPGLSPPPPPLTLSELSLIVGMLPNDEYEELNHFAGDEWMQSMILHEWAEEALRRGYRGKRKTIADQYSELSPAERETIDLLPPQEARERLMRRR